ncbi:RNA-binding domain-containing protein [Desulfobaculum sp. SPO524]|uniref:RNA-binding domain-containing protein n=1 Tax=Desulfobaculum sp. SPO524 TaxID=3378071 RepID=UPI0038525163
MNDRDFKALCDKSESFQLDFKAEMYDFSGADKKEKRYKRSKFVKDILSMANTPRDSESRIILGVKEHPDGSNDLLGIEDYIDDADLQSKLHRCVHPMPQFAYETVIIDGCTFGIITIPPYRDHGPFFYTGRANNILKERTLYLRRGTQNDIATYEEEKDVFAWFLHNSEPLEALSQYASNTWDPFVNAVDCFDPRRSYILTTTALSPQEANGHLSYLGSINWAFVADFDHKSSSSGALKHVKTDFEKRRALHQMTIEDDVNYCPTTSTYWYYTRGIDGRDSTISIGRWIDWKAKYVKDIRLKMSKVSNVVNRPITIVVLLYDEQMHEHMRSFLEIAYEELSDGLDVVIVSNNSDEAKNIAQLFDAIHFSLPLHQLLGGLHQFRPKDALTEDSSIPSSSGAPLVLDHEEIAWLSEELEIVHMGIGNSPEPETETTNDYRRGKTVSWYDLALRLDIDRDLSRKLERKVRESLTRRRAERINLYHEPGAGGTTIGCRLLWDMKHEYPCVRLNSSSSSQNTAERIGKLYSISKLPVLVLIDGNKVSQAQSNDLNKILASRNVPTTFVIVQRRYEKTTRGDNLLFLPAELSDRELPIFTHVLCRDVPKRADDIQRAAQGSQKAEKTLFYLGLVAFEKEYVSLEDFVRRHLAKMNEKQRTILICLAMAHYYGQTSMEAQFFADYLGLPPNKPVDLQGVFDAAALNLITYEKGSKWRPLHYLISEKVLEIGMQPKGFEGRTWKQFIVIWAKKFISICSRGEKAWAHIMELLQQVFIYRDNNTMLGTEQSGRELFSRIISDIPNDEGKLSIFKRLTESFPENHHYWAHLGRFYSHHMGDYANAIAALERALEIDDSDHVIHHMKGMALRRQLDDMIQQGSDIKEVVEKAKQASDSFTESREINPENEYGYVSESQTIIRLLDYCGKEASSRPLLAAANSSDEWVRGAFERAENLLSELRLLRQTEQPSDHELRCRANLDALYGDHGEALQAWQNLLDKQVTYAPPIRRQIVWTLLSKHKRDWGTMAKRDVDRIVNLLKANIEEEPGKANNLRLWLQAVRELDLPPSIETVIEKVAYWSAVSDDLDASYYLYVLYALQAFSGSTVAVSKSYEHLEKCKHQAQRRRDRLRSFEWAGSGAGIKQLVHQSSLGEWNRDLAFWRNTTKLVKMEGVISEIRGPEKGTIEVGGMKAFFVPSVAGYSSGQSENLRVRFYVGFSYDGLRAWDVEDA